MGFRSVVISSDYGNKLPDWFLEKWGDWFHWYVHPENGTKGLPFSSIVERKTYWFGRTAAGDELKESLAIELANDCQKWWDEDSFPFTLSWLHECHGVTTCHVYKSKIIWQEPKEMEVVPEITHHYCHCAPEYGAKESEV